jgi:hypothetical protein
MSDVYLAHSVNVIDFMENDITRTKSITNKHRRII